MEYPHTRYGYHQSPTDADVGPDPPQYFAEPETGILEPALLNVDMMPPPDASHLRKAPFDSNMAIVPPTHPLEWSDRYGDGAASSIDPSAATSATYHPHRGFVSETSRLPPSAWAYIGPPDDCTPPTRMDFEHPSSAHPHFEHAPHYIHQRTDSARGSFSQPVRHPTYDGPEESFIPAPQVQTPLSPHSHQDWMTLAAQEDERRPHSRRMRAQSPSQTVVDFQRRDGIRKKNARIDIPQERSIQTIEHMLETTTDEDTLKELKQQKRLLRNREAALASRQRKKKHTEDLEEKEKEFARTLENRDARIHRLAADLSMAERIHHELSQANQQLKREVQVLHLEKRDMEIKHKEVTASLRKRVQILEDHVENDLAPAMSAVPSSTGFADFNAGMENLSMSAHDWDSLIFTNELQNEILDDMTFDDAHEASSEATAVEKPNVSAVTAPTSSKHTTESTPDQNVPSGLLFFLLLCGAFVASKPASSQLSDLPQVPADVRAAAPKVLSNLLYDQQSPTTAAHLRTPLLDSSEPRPSNLPNVPSKPPSRLDQMHQRLTAPTRQQAIDSAFSLTTQEYASIANLDFPVADLRSPSHPDDEGTPRPRRNLAEALANMQDDGAGDSKAEVYTRSLLWDQIPPEVVKQFRELVRDYSDIDAQHEQEQQQQRRQHNHNDMPAIKAEP